MVPVIWDLKTLREKILKIPHTTCEKPNGAFYVFPNFSYYINSKNNFLKNSNDLCKYILDNTGVVSVSGDSFGSPGHIRFSYATSDKIINKAMDLVTSSLLEL